jgi:uncharacterized membrane protein YbaN (DUF454 family)
VHRNIYKGICIVAGFLFVVLGALVFFIPMVPSTPFLLVASYFFSKGSKRFYQWLINTSLYQNHLDQFVQQRSLSLTMKAFILLPASFVLISAFLYSHSKHVQLFIVTMTVIKFYYLIFRVKTIKEDVV